MAMKYLPLMHNFDRKTCLLVGGGKVALRRAKRRFSGWGDCGCDCADLLAGII